MNDTGPVWEYYCLPGESTQDGWRETLEPCLESAYICRNVYNLQRVAFGKVEVDSILQFKWFRNTFNY